MLTLLFLPLVVAAAVIASAKAGWKSTLAYGGVASFAFGIIGATLLEIPHGAIPPVAMGFFLGGLPGIGVLAGVGLQRLWIWLNQQSLK